MARSWQRSLAAGLSPIGRLDCTDNLTGVNFSGAEMDRAGRWAREQGVRVLCNEFGCIRAGVDAPSRYRWIHDMRSALEANDIGWTLWDYTDIFGITAQSAQPGQQGRRTLDPQAHGALGLLATAAATAAPARAGAR